jgi:hypothetical protein
VDYKIQKGELGCRKVGVGFIGRGYVSLYWGVEISSRSRFSFRLLAATSQGAPRITSTQARIITVIHLTKDVNSAMIETTFHNLILPQKCPALFAYEELSPPAKKISEEVSWL